MIALDLWHPPSRPVSAACAEEADVAWAALGSAHHPHTHMAIWMQVSAASLVDPLTTVNPRGGDHPHPRLCGRAQPLGSAQIMVFFAICFKTWFSNKQRTGRLGIMLRQQDNLKATAHLRLLSSCTLSLKNTCACTSPVFINYL